jgi:hypothetical protein
VHVRLAATQSERLRRKIELLLPALLGSGRRLIEHPQVRDLYPEYLVTSHAIIRASVPLMETARRRARELAGDDPVAATLAAYLEGHIEEEAGHDGWLLDDLETIGRDRAALLAQPPSETVASLVGAQYYWILHYHPVAVLGYIALLEGYPPTEGLVNELQTRTGYPDEAFRTLRLHAELDPGHKDALDELLDELPLTQDHWTVLGLSAMHSVRMLARSIDEVVDDCDQAAA